MKISVIIPVYNVEKYLEECIHSVLEQDFQDYEIILVNDGSTDNSGKMCDAYAEKYSQIKVIHKENGGLSDARNFGIKEAKGDYLIFLDSDDLWQGKNRLSEISSIIENQGQPDIIFFGMTTFFNEQTYIELNAFPSFPDTLTNDFQKDLGYLVENLIYKASACDKVIKKDIIISNELFFLRGKLCEDVAWCYDIIQHIKTYNIYPKSFYCYRKKREGSISYKIGEKSVIDIIDMTIERARNSLDSKEKNTFLFLYGYVIVIPMVNILSKENYKKYFTKLKEMSFLLDISFRNLSKKQKLRNFGYRLFGIKLAGKLEYWLKKWKTMKK